MINKLCGVNSNEDLGKKFKSIEHLLRNKRKEILLMEGNYEDVWKEIEEAIVKYMTLVPIVEKESVQTKLEIPMYVYASTTSSDEEEVEEI